MKRTISGRKKAIFSSILSFTVITLFIIIATILSKKSAPKYSEDKIVTISVGINKSLKSAPIIISKENGFFREEGIIVNISMETSAIPLVNKLFSGELDIVCAPEHLVALKSIKRTDFKIIALINRNQSHELIVNKSKGINNIKDLKGRKIGLTLSSSTKYSLYRLLLFHGLSLLDVKLINLVPPKMPNSISSGEVDGVITWPPFTALSKKAIGEKAISFNANMGRDLYWVILAKEKWISNNLKIIERFLKALQSGFEIINKSPKKAMATSIKYFKFPPSRVADEWKIYNFRLELPRGLILAMEQETKWEIEQAGENHKIPNFLKLIEYTPMENLYPETVDIIH